MIHKLLASANRSRTKNATIKAILETPQDNDSVINIHRIDPNNAGDFYCAPHHYFDILKGKSLDIFDYKIPDPAISQNFIQQISSNALIIGGGGLLNRSSFEKQMKLFESLSASPKKMVLWGVGHNEKHPKTYGKVRHYNIDINKFGLAGTRDFNMPGAFVPCVSCLHPLFDKAYQTTNDIGIVFHKKTLKNIKILNKFKDYPSSSNVTDFEKLVAFIGASDKIVTDSYHVMYWSMLMKKRVVVIPNSSKFFDFKHLPVVSDFDNALDQFHKTEIYPELLDECREINLHFAEKVFNYLNL